MLQCSRSNHEGRAARCLCGADPPLLFPLLCPAITHAAARTVALSRADAGTHCNKRAALCGPVAAAASTDAKGCGRGALPIA
jgi:hypothetical protein